MPTTAKMTHRLELPLGASGVRWDLARAKAEHAGVPHEAVVTLERAYGQPGSDDARGDVLVWTWTALI